MRRSRRVGSRPWARLRRAALQRDGYRCRECGTAGRLEVHHVVAVEVGGSNELANLKTVCRECHLEEHMSPEQRAWARYMAGKR